MRVRVACCGVCRTDLHVVDGELPDPRLPIIPGHEIVGRVDALGAGVTQSQAGRAGRRALAGRNLRRLRLLPQQGRENLCDRPLFTGYTRDGGYATHAVADARYRLRACRSGRRRRNSRRCSAPA